jgi:pSer/pThr/pTyr-binding forkhead associated (FHA) protein
LGQNPTRVNDVLIQEHFLQDGDRIFFGQTEFLVQIAATATHDSQQIPDETKTVIMPTPAAPTAIPRLIARTSDGRQLEFPLDKKILVGRSQDCDICLPDSTVSRRHAEIYYDGGRWQINDLASGNGTYLDGRPITQAVLPQNSNVQIGPDGPVIWLKIEGIEIPLEQRPESIQHTADYYFSDQPHEKAGEFTVMLHGAFQRVKKQHSMRYLVIIGAVIAMLIVSSAIGVYHYLRLQNAKEVAIDIFYNMKAISLQIAKTERMIEALGDTAQLKEAVADKRQELSLMEKRYVQFIEKFDVIKKDMSEEDRIITRVARIFGECDINIPPDFLREVKKYINKWKSTQRLKKAIHRLEEKRYVPVVYDAMVANGLPPHFLYLALQESLFDHRAVGRKTRFGIAKGIWQFIPSTARQYGLQIGPLANRRLYDPKDERFDFNAATQAAADFLRDIYQTDAQASGLLVMASYNWGPTAIKKRIREMPNNPRDRNFWNLLKKYKIPKETYDYVFYIVSAAAIGENPQLFGFDFENPLARPTRELLSFQYRYHPQRNLFHFNDQ